MVRRYDLAMSEPVAEQLTEDVRRIVQGYTFDEPAIELGVLMENDAAIRPAIIRIPLSMLNRHGLVAGATGTGKTKTLQLMTEQISAAGVPVFAADIKGDLSGIASPGQPNEKLLAGWSAGTPEHFSFTLKAPRRITHDAKLQRCEELTQAFCRTAKTLGPKVERG